jgi:hypothetical protein
MDQVVSGRPKDLNHPGNVLFRVDEANAGFVGQNVTYKFKFDGQKLSMATTIKSATRGEWGCARKLAKNRR